jgi:hypothetical protein
VVGTGAAVELMPMPASSCSVLGARRGPWRRKMFELPLKQALDEVEKQFGVAYKGQVAEAILKTVRGEGSN